MLNMTVAMITYYIVFINVSLDFKLKWTVIQDYYKRNKERKFTARHAIADTYIKYD